MRFRVLGPFEVLDEARVLELGRRKQRAVLAVLTLEANSVVALDCLIDLLWGDERPARATASLQVYVSNLRRVLEPGRLPDRPWDRLVTRPPGYLLRVGPDELDAERFKALAAEGRRLLATGQAGPARRVLDEALGLWRGEALADLSSEKFARPAIARLDELRQLATEDRIEADLDLGANASAVATLAGLVARFPLRERLWGMLMVALYRDGRQAEALRSYARAREVMIEELGIVPGPELSRLEGDILAQAPTLDWNRGPRVGAPAAIVVSPAGHPSAAVPPLVGRAADLARLDGLVAEAAAGRGCMVLVSGEPGIGKTRLGQELAARAAAFGATVSWGGSNEGEGPPPFWPWVQVLRTVLAGVGHGGLDDDATRRLAQLVPGAAALGSPGPTPGLDDETARFRLHQAVVDALTTVAARRALVVIVDDLHWADAASLALFQFVAARLAGTRILLVGTYRPTELAPDHPLVSTLAVVARLAAFQGIGLHGLSVTEVGELVARGWGVTPSDELAVALHARTDGNPFFLAELVKLLASEGTLGQADAVAAVEVPARVQDVLRRRLGRLPEATLALLRVAAVAGRSFDLGVLAAATGHDVDRTLDSVDALVGVVVEDGSVVGRYRFTHALVQQVLYDGLSGMRRARLHARVGGALEALDRDGARLSELARHFWRAAPAVGPAKAVAYALEAASAAQAGQAHEAVEEHLGRALELVVAMPAGPDRDCHELRIQNRLAVARMLKGGLVSPAAARAFDRAAELALALGDTQELLSSMVGAVEEGHHPGRVAGVVRLRCPDAGTGRGIRRRPQPSCRPLRPRPLGVLQG